MIPTIPFVSLFVPLGIFRTPKRPEIIRLHNRSALIQPSSPCDLQFSPHFSSIYLERCFDNFWVLLGKIGVRVTVGQF